MRLVASVIVAVAAIASVSACSSRSSAPDYPRYGGYGTVTEPGLEVHGGSCLYDRSSMLASGMVRQTSERPAGSRVAVTLFVPVGNGAVHFERTVDYPSPATTGADVPFRLVVDTEGQPGMACEIQVGWAATTTVPAS